MSVEIIAPLYQSSSSREEMISHLIMLDMLSLQDRPIANMSPADMKLMWNLFIRHYYKEDLLVFTPDEIHSYIETDCFRGCPVPRFITAIAKLRGEIFFDNAHMWGRFVETSFENFLVDYIWFIKQKLFRYVSLSQETMDWIFAPEGDDGIFQLPKLALAVYSGSQELKERYDLSDPEQRLVYLSNFCLTYFPGSGCEYPKWLLDQVNLPAIADTESDLTPRNTSLTSSHRNHAEYTQSTYAKDGVNLVGWARTAVGIGEDVRVGAHALLSVGIPFDIQDAAQRMPPAPIQQDLGVDDYITELPCYQTDIVFLDAATQYRYYCCDLLKSPFLDRAIIGVCPWELPNWPKELAFAVDHLTGFWAATKYIYDAFLPHFQDRIKLAPPAVLLPQHELDDFKITMINEPLTFLTTFDGLSSVHRKNPFAVIKAFKAAFSPSCKDVRLIVKTMNFSASHPVLRELAKEVTSDSRIELISQALLREELFALVRRSHCFVSLHRSEGFGRNIAEAMLFNRPVICSAYSGNLDFCFEQNSFLVEGREIPVEPGQYAFSNQQTWFDASVEHASERMREVYENREKAERKAEAGRDYIRSFHCVEATGLRYQKLLQDFI